MSVVRSGWQRPTVEVVPDYAGTTGREACELAALAGLVLDDWQAHVLTHALGEREDGGWAAFEVGLVVPRQNGKGALLEARELAGLFLLRERLIIHSAHQFDTSLEAFRRLLFLIEDTPDLDREVKRVVRSHGEEGIELRNGCRIRFRTRTKGGGRGFSSDCLILDEAMVLPETAHGALLPTLSARPNPQVWYAGSAVDQYVHENGVVLSRLRRRALGNGGDVSGLAYFEWSLDVDNPDMVEERTAKDPEMWARANPGLGIRIDPDHVALERASMDPRTFAVERLNVGDWWNVDQQAGVIDIELWDDRGAEAAPVTRESFAFDIAPDRSSACVAAAGLREDGCWQVDIEHRRGTGWVVEGVLDLLDGRSASVACDASGPAASLLAEFEQAGIEVQTMSAKEYAQACGRFYDDTVQDHLRHLGAEELRTAVKGAAQRPLGDAWAWSRKNSAVDITPLVAATLALWMAVTAVENSWGFV